MLKNAPTLAIRGVDTAENEPTFEPMARAGSRADGFLRALVHRLLHPAVLDDRRLAVQEGSLKFPDASGACPVT